MKSKKVISLALSAVMLVPALTSCSIGGHRTVEDGKTIYSYSLNMYTQDDNEYPRTSDTVFDNLLKDKFGIRFNYDRIPRTDWETKTNTYFATGEEPDITIGGKEMNYKNWSAEGQLAPIDYKKLPNWCALWGDDLEKVVALASSPDGNLYYLPTVRQEKVQMCWLYREDVFKKLNLEFPQTADEFLEVCKKIKAAYPNSIIVSSNGQKKSALTGFYQMFWIPELILQSHSCVDPVTGEFVPYALTSDNARDMYKFISALNKEGLIDKEILSIEKENFYTRCTQDNAFITYNYVYNTDLINTKTNVNGKTDANWDWAPNMVTGYPDKGTIYKKDPTYSNWGPAFSWKLGEDEERFDALLKYYDWCATEEGQLFTSYGVEGESYNMVNGQPEVADGWYHEKDSPKGKKINREFGILTYTFIKHSKLFDELRGRQINQLYDAYMANDDYYYFDEFPMRYTQAEEERYTDLEVSLNSKRDEYMARFFSGASDPNNDADWNQYISDMKKMGLDEFIELQTTVYNRTQAEIK